MSRRMIIRNCPAYSETQGVYWTCYEDNNKLLCQDCTDCVMKQIVELCNGIKCPCEYKGADCWECTESGARRFADKILKLLDIQEVE